MKQSRLVFALLSAVILLVCGFQHSTEYAYARALEQTNFLHWCESVEESSLHTCYISCGTGADSVGRDLTAKEIRDLCDRFQSLSSADIILTEDHKGYAMVDEQEIRLTFRDAEGEYILRYRPHNPTELYLGGWGDNFGKRQVLWTTQQALIDFILTHSPK